MPIAGRGFLAQHFSPHAERLADAVLFAAGVSDSRSTDLEEYRREAGELNDAISACRATGRRLVYFSSAGAVYGSYPPDVHEALLLAPVSAHGRHKAAIEGVVQASGIDFLILRLSNAVGPGQRRHQLVPAIVDQIQSGAVTVWRSAHRDLIDIADVVRLTLALVDAGVSREIFNLASGRSIEVADVVDYVEARLGRRARRTWIDRPDRYSVRIDKLKAALGPSAVSHMDERYYRTVIDSYLASIYRPIDLSIYR
jgi:nucleoside-diphosphate-sugar epimerase